MPRRFFPLDQREYRTLQGLTAQQRAMTKEAGILFMERQVSKRMTGMDFAINCYKIMRIIKALRLLHWLKWHQPGLKGPEALYNVK